MTPFITKDLRRDEGFIPHAYKDTEGLLTIGIGRLIDQSRNGGITEAEAEFLLANDLKRFEAGLDAKLPWWRTLSDERQDVLLNMAFNMGVDGLLTFKNTLAMVKAGDYAGAAKNMLNSKWATQVGGRASRLADQMRTGTRA
jgi:lysozyme